VRRTCSISVANLVAACALLVARSMWSLSAQAGSLRTVFDLGSTTIAVASPIGDIDIPPDGTVGGSMTALAPTAGNGTTSVISGIGAITTIDLNVLASIFVPLAEIHGTVNSDMGGGIGRWGYGLFTLSGADGTAVSPAWDIDNDPMTPPVGSLIMRMETHLTCSGLFCGLAGNFPIDKTVSDPSTQSLTVNIFNVNSPGNATITGTLVTDIAEETATSSTPALITIIGTEVSRSVPEPGVAWMLLAGVGGLCGLSRSRRAS